MNHNTTQSDFASLLNIFDWDENKTTKFYMFSFTEELDKISDLKQICEPAEIMWKLYIWILCAIGIPGNILTIIATLTMQAMSPATFFVTLLAAFDGGALVLKLIYHQLTEHRVPIGDFGCKFEFLVVFIVTTANWMLVLISAERFVSVCYPLKKISIVTKRRSYIAAAGISVFFFVFYLIVFILARGALGNQCVTFKEYVKFYSDYYYFFNAFFFLFIPFLFIAFFTIAIIRALFISRRDRRILLQKGSCRQSGSDAATINNQRIVAESERVERAITIMMILAAALFLVFSIPACVYIFSYRDDYRCSDKRSAYIIVFKQVQFVLMDTTHALNFFLYFIAAKRFRNQLIKVLKGKACKKERRNNKSQLTYSTQISMSSKINSSVSPMSPVK